MPASTILILESADAGAQSLTPILTTSGYTVTRTSEPDEAFAKVAENQLAIIDMGKTAKGAKTAFDLCREIRATPTTAPIPILCVAATDDVEERISFLEAGADDVVARPFDAREIEARVEALLLRFQRSKELAPVVSADGLTLARPRRTIAVYSPKGGVGTTTIATNIAVAAAQRKADRVVLVDLDLQFGGVATHLNLEPKQTLADVVRDASALREPELLRSYATRHDSGLHVLAAPANPEASELITADHVSHILGTLLEGYDAIVVDAGSALDERVLRVFEAAENIVLPVHPEMSALKAVHGLLEYLNEAGSISAKSTFVLNNMFAREILKPRDIESALGTRISSDLPYDPFLYLKAVNEGVPIVLGAPRSPAAEHLVKLSATAFGADGFMVPAGQIDKKPRRFGFGRRS
ncbi:MAG TPA: AAA family ATPase [Candidatus Limnocylindrales bacterium]|jgi:pilus assembly protein CpaE|nr:AAA family ATPase [Candidatus Limnocylindrales bacterium]